MLESVVVGISNVINDIGGGSRSFNNTCKGYIYIGS